MSDNIISLKGLLRLNLEGERLKWLVYSENAKHTYIGGNLLNVFCLYAANYSISINNQLFSYELSCVVIATVFSHMCEAIPSRNMKRSVLFANNIWV